MENNKKKTKFSLSAFTIILILIYVLAIISHLLPSAQFDGELIVDGSGVIGATLSQTLMAPVYGFVGTSGIEGAIHICFFILVLGAFLKMVSSTKAVEDGVKVLIKKFNGREIMLIPILMVLFSIGGTTCGTLEETVVFYGLLASAMVLAGMDTIVSSAIVLLGAGSGVLGSTINPLSVGAMVDAVTKVLPEGLAINQGTIIGVGAILWLTSLAISIFFVMRYAKKIIKRKGSTFLSLQEQKDMEEEYRIKEKSNKPIKLIRKQKITLWLCVFTFVVLIIGFIPWENLAPGVFDFFSKYTGYITGQPLGYWYFNEASLWLLLMTVIIGIVNGYHEKKLVDIFVDGAMDMVSVILVVAVARGASILMQQTYLDNYIIFNIAKVLQDVPKVAFAPLNYILHIGLSVLVPSSSGLATLSSPIMGPLAYQLGYNVEVTLMEMVAANGLVNLFTPTCGVILAGLALAKVKYTTWLKWVAKVVITIALANMIILTLAMVLL